MTRTKFIALFLFTLSITLPAAALGQSKKAENAASLLYQVSGNGLAKPSYIFGTFHAVCASEMVPFEDLDTYLTETDQLMMEIDMDDAAEMQSMTKGIMIPGGKTLKDLLTADKFAKVDEMMKNYLGYSAENVKMVKPAMLTIMALTSPKAIGCTPTVYDLKLMQNAVAVKKPVVGLETVASQIAVIDSKPLEEQAEDLYKTAQDPQKSIDGLKKLMAAYKTRDVENLFKMVSKGESKDEKFKIRLLDDRNRAWIPKLETAFKEKPTFVAVGAGHLGGKNGVIRLLRKKGYQVTPVMLGSIAAGDN
jgi:uncharacterized protein YbaP (TraB family)